MEILKLKTFIQPDGKTRVTIRKLETPDCPPLSCERLVNGRWQERSLGCENNQADKMMASWEKFERHIHSREM